MKKILYILLALLGVCQLSACGGDDKDPISPEGAKMVGEWHLISWNAALPADFDAYIAFDESRSFVIYQKIEKSYYQKFTGNFLINGTDLTGLYSDSTPWGSSYQVSFDNTGDIMTMLSASSVGEVSVYKRTPIPASIKSESRSTRAIDATLRLL